ncbi:glycosyl hydrolase family 18 protein [Pigmentibacter sp. JX0631]|uniref:glycosyl hydrolase family 18 protein n=1 Tax=Pigmentibacter sp. JX0631 TaxID=2976982 RepID=UPI0024694232|nr:glycosyl hydrolase family 18 protein [Pigmentibacter sp. JX0631]WGL59521.1 glycosyl hydrolase family 18 protein [Pigmentibacter sp. JX0631]
MKLKLLTNNKGGLALRIIFTLAFNYFFLFDIALSQTMSKTIFNPYSEFTEYLEKKGDLSLKEVIKKNNLKYITLSFIQDADKCLPAWDGLKNNKIDKIEIIKLLNEIKSTDVSYFISLGGQDGNNLAIYCKNSAELLKNYEKIIKIYQPVGLDFDLEGKILDNKVALKKIMNAIKDLQNIYQNLKISITIPVMPSGLNSVTKELLSELVNKNIKFTVNLLTMNYAEDLSGNMFKYTQSALINSFLFLKKIHKKVKNEFLFNTISVTPMIGRNDLKNEIFTLHDAKNLLIESKKLKLSEIRMWSLERDKRCRKNLNLKICSGLKNQKNYEFTNIFNSLNINF